MKLENIDEAENLITKYRHVMALKAQVRHVVDNDKQDHYWFCASGSEDIDPGSLMGDVFEGFERVLADQYDKIVARLRELD